MGCCFYSRIEASIDMAKTEKDYLDSNESDFVEVYLQSDEEIPNRLEEWRAYKYKTSNSESSAILSTLLHSDRKISVYSKPGSIIDSFAVNALSIHKN